MDSLVFDSTNSAASGDRTWNLEISLFPKLHIGFLTIGLLESTRNALVLRGRTKLAFAW